jgi:hypothetical protein
MQDTPQTYSGPQSSRSQPSRFVEHMQQLFGEDPDPLFLEESWTVGVPVAIEKLHRRRSQRAAHLSRPDMLGEDRAIRELERMASLTGNVENFLEDRSQPIETRYSPAWPQYAPAASSENRLASEFGAYNSRQANTPVFGISTSLANELLGVSPIASREEVRSAYRRKVSQCHPDRCQDASDAVRRRATQQLADLNEAYRVLSEQLFHQAA